MASPALLACIETLERDPSLLAPEALDRRIAAIERLDALLFGEGAEPVRRRAATLLARLEDANQVVFDQIRAAVRRGEGATALHPWLRLLATGPRACAHGDGYDALDTLLAGVLALDEPVGGDTPLPADMVFYQPTPARHILDLIERSGLDETDVLIDLGSGLGHVPLLAAICTGARGLGIERNAAYVACARHCAASLGLQRVDFIAQDARTADLSGGTLFYLYTPFGGPILRCVLDMLKHEAATRAIRVATLGPCTATVASEPWLHPAETPCPDRIALFHSIPRESRDAPPMQERTG